jgi:hypothetical protein
MRAKRRKPANIDWAATILLRELLIPQLCIDIPMPVGYKFYVVDQTRGRCNMTHKVITIPLWCFTSLPFQVKLNTEYRLQYIAHELAHAYQYDEDKYNGNHGPRFMRWLKILCPPELLHYELSYKPRNAIAAGIGLVPLLDTL